jgi:hypothetical protein
VKNKISMKKNVLLTLSLLALTLAGLPPLPQNPNSDDTSLPYGQMLVAMLNNIRKSAPDHPDHHARRTKHEEYS